MHDSTFEIIFGRNSDRLLNILNSIYFRKNNMQITDLIITPNEYPKINNSFNKYSLRTDITCKCKIINLKGEIAVDIEM